MPPPPTYHKMTAEALQSKDASATEKNAVIKITQQFPHPNNTTQQNNLWIQELLRLTTNNTLVEYSTSNLSDMIYFLRQKHQFIAIRSRC